MRSFWAFCAGAALVGMSLSYVAGDGFWFGINAVCFMGDLGLLLFTEE